MVYKRITAQVGSTDTDDFQSPKTASARGWICPSCHRQSSLTARAEDGQLVCRICHARPME